MGPKGGCNLDLSVTENYNNNNGKVQRSPRVHGYRSSKHMILLYILAVMMPGRRYPQVRGPDKGGSTVHVFCRRPQFSTRHLLAKSYKSAPLIYSIEKHSRTE